MGYFLGEITSEIQKKIIMDATGDKEKIRRLSIRGGHFNINPKLSWAVDKENNNYLFISPRRDYLSPGRDYYFFYKEKMYGVFIQSQASGRVEIIDEPQDELLDDFKSELKKAFEVHRYSGLGEGCERQFIVEFEGE